MNNTSVDTKWRSQEVEETFAFIMYPNAETTDEPQVLKQVTFFRNRRFQASGRKRACTLRALARVN